MCIRKWLRLAFFNLFIVSLAGVLLRYKILFYLPWIDQKNLLHGHSHFAFSGWVSQALMALIAHSVTSSTPQKFERYNKVLWLNLACAWGMLLSFPVQGYGLISILFSNGAIAAGVWFALLLFRDVKTLPEKTVSHKWFLAGSVFNVLSSLGAFSLAYMMATHHSTPDHYLSSVYFFLHFQYNGWFSFAVLGLLAGKLTEAGINDTDNMRIYLLFVYAAVPAYLLSVLWLNLPVYLYAFVIAAVGMQIAGCIYLLRALYNAWPYLRQVLGATQHKILSLSLLAFTIKIVLQAASVVPVLSNLAFGFRPIVIGYLHLVLLGFISLFILGYSLRLLVPATRKLAATGVWVFVSGVILNEIVLMTQGAADIAYLAVPFSNEILMIIAIIIASGLAMLNLSANDVKKGVL